VVRVPGYRSRGPGLNSWRYQIFWGVVGLERGPLSLVSTIEELLGRNSSGSDLQNREYGPGEPLRWPRDTLYAQKLALTSPTSGGLSVGIVCLRTEATEFRFFLPYCLLWKMDTYFEVFRPKCGKHISFSSFSLLGSPVSALTVMSKIYEAKSYSVQHFLHPPVTSLSYTRMLPSIFCSHTFSIHVCHLEWETKFLTHKKYWDRPYEYIFRRPSVLNRTATSAIQNEMFHCFPRYLRTKPGIVPKLGHDRFQILSKLFI
jgi:hypothetical protein